MASISALGVGSNLDLSSLLTQLSSAEQTRLTPLTTQQSSYKAKLTAWGVVNSSLQNLQTAANGLAKASQIATTKVTSTNSAFTATVGAGVAGGNYSVEVSALAQSQTLTSGEFASKTAQIGGATGSRTITITQPGKTDPLTVTLTDDQTTLSGIRDAINQKQSSVTASIVKADDDSYYLSLTSKDTGLANTMTVAVTGDDVLQGKIGFNSASGTNGLHQTIAAQDAKLKINDIAITRSTNTITDAPEGVTLTLNKTNIGAPENLVVSQDSSGMTSAIQAYVDAYNSLQTTLSNQTKYSAVDKGSNNQASSNGDLIGDGTLRSIQTQLQSLLTRSQGGDYATLSSLGITMGTDGKLSVDSSKLNSALATKPGSVTNFFVGDGKETGFGTQASALLTKMLDADGQVATATKGINTSLKRLSDDIDNTTASINTNIARYKAQFTQLDTIMSQFNNTANYLTQQFNAMN